MKPIISFPATVHELPQWASSQGMTYDAALQVYIQFSCTRIIADDNYLNSEIILRGSAALRLFYGHCRNTDDMDFMANSLRTEFPADAVGEPVLRRLLETLRGGLLKYFQPVSDWQDAITKFLKIHLSPNFLQSEIRRIVLPGCSDNKSILISGIEDILADKLTAMLRQPWRLTNRPQDLFDVVHILRFSQISINLDKLKQYFEFRCLARTLVPAPGCFDSQIKAITRPRYDELVRLAGDSFIPFEDAWKMFLEAVGDLCDFGYRGSFLHERPPASAKQVLPTSFVTD